MKKVLLAILAIVFILFLFLFWGGSILTEMSINSKIEELRESTDFTSKELFSYSELEDYPQLIKNYFKSVIINNKPKPKFVTVEQTAQFKTDETSDWKQIEAEQYFTTEKPNFLWNAKLASSKLFWVQVIDSYINGKGNMLIKLNSSITISSAWGIEMDKSGLVRYLSEAVLFPTALLPNDNLIWDVLDSNVAEIKFKDETYSVVARVFFSEDGTISKLETLDKYRTTDAGYKKTLYTIYYGNYKWINDSFYIPTYVEVEWKLPSDNFKYGKFTITNVLYE